MTTSKCATCTTLRRKIRELQAQAKKLEKKAETPSEKEARIKKVRASFTKARAKRAQKERQ